jgi:hypothetical protein
MLRDYESTQLAKATDTTEIAIFGVDGWNCHILYYYERDRIWEGTFQKDDDLIWVVISQTSLIMNKGKEWRVVRRAIRDSFAQCQGKGYW